MTKALELENSNALVMLLYIINVSPSRWDNWNDSRNKDAWKILTELSTLEATRIVRCSDEWRRNVCFTVMPSKDVLSLKEQEAQLLLGDRATRKHAKDC